jgi:lipoprotein-anchoring transpeptidase ErfK/SrfK
MKLTRRNFLKLGAAALGSLAFAPYFPQKAEVESGDLARIAIKSVSVYSQPNDESRIVYTRYRDDLLHIYYPIVSPDGPGYNPNWYRVWGGYIHTGHIQRVRFRMNSVLEKAPEKPQLARVTVPFTQAMHLNPARKTWEPIYRLYYDSNHWIVGIDEGPDGQPWYKLQDELFDTLYFYHVPAVHMQPIPPEEFAPLSPDVPPGQKLIKVSIAQQLLTAYEGDNIVMQTKISSGLPDSRENPPNGIPTDTPKGEYNIQSKMPSKHMGDGNITTDLEAYELPGVPWTCFFVPKTGVATHGAYWHQNFGIPMSHGCVNMKPEEAQWIFRWTTPVAAPEKIETIGMGTRVIVF